MNPMYSMNKEKVIYGIRNEKNKSRHTLSIIYDGLNYRLQEWYIDDETEYTKESLITDEEQKVIYSLLFKE